jgi:O-antigen/teichoic acid export membrane protein/O-antigen ligase
MSALDTLRARVNTKAGRSVVGSLAASGGLQLLVIVSGVIVARSLGPADRGYFALLLVVAVVCGLIGHLGIPTAMTYYIAKEPRHARRITRDLASVRFLQLGSAFVLQVVALVVLVQGDPQKVKVAAVVTLFLPAGVLMLDTGLAILQGQHRFTWFNVLRIVPGAAYVVLVALAFVTIGVHLVVVTFLWVGTMFVGGLLALVVGLRSLPSELGPEPGPPRPEMVRFGFRAMLGTVSPVDAVRLDQLVVGLFLAPMQLGFYVVAQAFTQLPRVVAASVGMVAYPQVAARSERDARKHAMWRFFGLGVLLSGLVVLGLEVLTPTLLPFFFEAKYDPAVPIAQILLIGTLFMAARRVLSDGVNGLGHPGLGTIAEVASWLFIIPGIAVLLPLYGAKGVAAALTIAWAASLALLIVLALFAERTPAWGDRIRGLPARLPIAIVLALVAVVAVALLAGVAAAYDSTMALTFAVLLIAGLAFAYGRKTVALRGLSALPLMREPSASDEDLKDDGLPPSALATPRRIYYAGVLTLGLLTFRAGGQLAFSDLLFLLSLMLACAEFVILRGRVPIKLPFLLSLGIALFCVGGFVSTFVSYEALKSIAVIGRIVFLTVFWFWAGTVVLRRFEHLTKAVRLWVASAAICGFGAVVQVIAGGGVLPNLPPSEGRATGFTSHPNDLGGLTAIAFVPALMLAARPGLSFGKRLGSYLMLFLIAGALILSGSVGAFLAALVALFVWFALQRTSFDSMMVFATLVACLVGITTLQTIRGDPGPLARFKSVTAGEQGPNGAGSVDQRVTTYKVAVKRIKQDPFIGVGLDLYSITKPFGESEFQYDVHNIVLGVWYKTGLVGLVGMMLALFAIVRAGWIAIMRSKAKDEMGYAVSLLSASVAFVVFAMSEPVLFSRFCWIGPALLLALRATQMERGPVTEPVAEQQPDRAGIALAPPAPATPPTLA